jgi:hypothetical protein
MSWKPPKAINPAVADLLVSLGLRKRGPRRRTAVDLFLERNGVIAPLPWVTALGTELADAERRAVRLQHLRVIDPTAFVLMLDTFNEILIQAFSRCHAGLAPAFAAAAGKASIPDYGNWLGNGMLQKEIPVVVPWLSEVHKLRLAADLAHAKHKKGPKAGRPTTTISYDQVTKLMRGAREAWDGLIHAWQPLV